MVAAAHQWFSGGVDAVAAAFEAVPRKGFLPSHARSRASFDGPITIGHGQTSSQPRTVAAMLRLLEVRPGDRVLDVGSGSGWTTALLAHLTGPKGVVIGVELVPELAVIGLRVLAEREELDRATTMSSHLALAGGQSSPLLQHLARLASSELLKAAVRLELEQLFLKAVRPKVMA